MIKVFSEEIFGCSNPLAGHKLIDRYGHLYQVRKVLPGGVEVDKITTHPVKKGKYNGRITWVTGLRKSNDTL